MDDWTPTAADPSVWLVAFNPYSDSRIVRTISFGRFKHVGAMAHVPGMRAWVTYDVGFRGTRITVIPDDKNAPAILDPWIGGCTLVRMRRDFERRRMPPLFGWCVPAVAALLGLPFGALRPDALFRQCLANGGEIICGNVSPEAGAAGPRSSA